MTRASESMRLEIDVHKSGNVSDYSYVDAPRVGWS